jgi:hypothetical protein
MITWKRVKFFLFALFFLSQVVYNPIAFPKPVWPVAPLFGAVLLVSVGLTVVYSINWLLGWRVLSATFGGLGVVVLVRGFGASLSQTFAGVVLLGGAAGAFWATKPLQSRLQPSPTPPEVN